MSDKDEEPSDKAQDVFHEAIKHDVIRQVDNIVDFSKAMITLVSGFFVAYFVLLNFLGLETVDDVTVEYSIFVTPIFLILSIIFFAVSAMPIYFIRRAVNLSRPLSIAHYRGRLMTLKYTPMIIGMGLFISGLISTLYISLDALI